jgi:RecA/RadA recombinase
MKPDRSAAAAVPRKAPTVIAGFDEISGGGLPRGRTTLLMGGSGSGKTIFSLQSCWRCFPILQREDGRFTGCMNGYWRAN